MGFSEQDVEKMKKQPMGKLYFGGFIASLVLAYVLAHVVSIFGAETWQEGAVTGFWMWLGFVATKTLGGVLWEGKKLDLYLLNVAYDLVMFLLMGAILAVWA